MTKIHSPYDLIPDDYGQVAQSEIVRLDKSMSVPISLPAAA